MPRRNTAIAFKVLVVGMLFGGAWRSFDWGHAPVEKLPNLHGKSLNVVIASLGQPDHELEYKMIDNPGGEFRVELYNTYPPEDAKAGQARIKEFQWHRPQYCVAVWMHHVNGDWGVLDTCPWKKGVLF